MAGMQRTIKKVATRNIIEQQGKRVCRQQYMHGQGRNWEKFDKSNIPSNSVEYTYNSNGQLIKEVGKTPNGWVIYQNYEASYEYDNDGNKIQETKVFTTSPTKSTITTVYSYNKEGQLTEEKTEDSEISMNNNHLKYEYDSNRKKTKVLRWSQKENKWNGELLMDWIFGLFASKPKNMRWFSLEREVSII